jgi:hypothetical protein
METPALVHLKITNQSQMETATELKKRHHHDGSADRDWIIYAKIPQRNPSLLYIRYIRIHRTRNHIMGAERKRQGRQEVNLGMASSTKTNLMESVENGTGICIP